MVIYPHIILQVALRRHKISQPFIPVFYGVQATPPPMKTISGIFHFFANSMGNWNCSYSLACYFHFLCFLMYDTYKYYIIITSIAAGIAMFVMLDINIIYVLHNTYIIVQVIWNLVLHRSMFVLTNKRCNGKLFLLLWPLCMSVRVCERITNCYSEMWVAFKIIKTKWLFKQRKKLLQCQKSNSIRTVYSHKRSTAPPP